MSTPRTNTPRCRWLGVAMTGVMLAGAHQVKADPQAGVWPQPQQRPVSREQLPPQEFAPLFKSAVERLHDATAQANAGELTQGCRIERIIPGGQADKLGMLIGDVLVAIDEKPLICPAQLDRLRTKEKQSLIVHTATGEERTVEIEPGMNGIGSQPIVRLYTLCLKSKQRDDRWVTEVMVSLRVYDTDPDLAETAWQHAFARGYKPDLVSETAGLAIALAQGRNDAALDLAWHLSHADDWTKRLPIAPRWVYRAAIADGRWDVAMQMLTSYGDLFNRTAAANQPVLAAYRARSGEGKSAAPLTASADALPRRNLLAAATSAGGQGESIHTQLQRSGVGLLAPASDQYVALAFIPDHAVTDMDLRVAFSAKPTDALVGPVAKAWAIGFFDLDRAERYFTGYYVTNRGVQSILFDGIGGVVLSNEQAGGVLTKAVPDLNLRPLEEQNVRLVRLGNQAEIHFNGRRVLAIPTLLAPKRMEIFITSRGLTMKIHRLDWRELIQQP
jgi:hypothetical protein